MPCSPKVRFAHLSTFATLGERPVSVDYIQNYSTA